jgi:hypothetical protein
MAKLLNTLRKRAGVRGLLSATNSNPKVAKNGKLGVLTAVLHLAPGDMSGHEVCPKRSPGCTAACLHYAGSPAYMSGKTTARIARTKLLFADRNLFMNILALEIHDHLLLAEKENMEPAIRLNGTSDIVWEKKKFILFPEVAELLGSVADNILSLFPTVQFYDYTAIPRRSPPANYHLTFSLKETNSAEAIAEMKRGTNLAVVFSKKLPVQVTLGGRDLVVINGDDHDYRPVDPSGVVVGLKAKGSKGTRDATGFVRTLPGNDHILPTTVAA